MTTRAEEIAVINDNEGELVELSNKKKARVRPFTVEELFSDELEAASVKIGTAIWSQVKPFLADASATKPTFEVLSNLDLVGAFRSCKKEMRYCLRTCVDVPLSEIPSPDLPLLLGAFIRQNFSRAQLQSWADLLKSLATAIKAGTKVAAKSSSSTSATPARSSSTTDTPAGGSTAPPSSNTGSGGA